VRSTIIRTDNLRFHQLFPYIVSAGGVFAPVLFIEKYVVDTLDSELKFNGNISPSGVIPAGLPKKLPLDGTGTPPIENEPRLTAPPILRLPAVVVPPV
jgi:hypothetical protein